MGERKSRERYTERETRRVREKQTRRQGDTGPNQRHGKWKEREENRLLLRQTEINKENRDGKTGKHRNEEKLRRDTDGEKPKQETD